MNNRDEEFSKRLAATLDAGVDALDDDTRARLAAARQHALRHSSARSRNRRAAIGLAVAAGLATLAVAPNLFNEAASTMQQSESGLRAGAEDMAYLGVDPQMLDDMDMLQAMDELQSDGDSAAAAHNARGES